VKSVPENEKAQTYIHNYPMERFWRFHCQRGTRSERLSGQTGPVYGGTFE
jgi:hypothetical protein